EAQDCQGWTPLHHAVLVSPEIENMLSNLCDPAALPKTKAKGTVEDIRILSGLKPCHFSAAHVTLRLPGKPDTKLSDTPSMELKRVMGLEHYSDSSIFDPSQWQKLWNQEIVKNEGTQTFFHQHLDKSYQTFKKKPYAFVVAPCPQ